MAKTKRMTVEQGKRVGISEFPALDVGCMSICQLWNLKYSLKKGWSSWELILEKMKIMNLEM